jgi:hypothetical protein
LDLSEADGFDAAHPERWDVELLHVARPNLAEDVLVVGDAAMDVREQHPSVHCLRPAPSGVGGRLLCAMTTTAQPVIGHRETPVSSFTR